MKAVAVERAREAARPPPARILRFPHLQQRGRPTSARIADQTVEVDWRQAMPRTAPALGLATLPLSAVVGAAITTAITTPVTQSGGHEQGVLPTGGCAGTATLRLPLGKPRD